MLHLPDGRRKSSAALVQALLKLGGVRQQQIVQQAVDRVLVRSVPAGDWTPGHEVRIRELVEEFFEMPIRTEIEVVERLELPRSGKLRAVINELDSSR